MVVVLLLVLSVVSIGFSPTDRADAAAPPLRGVRVDGRQLVDTDGRAVALHGVNRMGTEYACIQGWGVFDGNAGRSENASILAAMETWRINAVRVPLNESCWLDRDTEGLEDRQYVGPAYRAAISEWVGQVTGRGMAAIVDLHWSAPAGVPATTQQPMADVDNSPDFWRSVASAFKDNPLVIFDLFNEPYLDRDDPPPADPWACWRDGCSVFLHEGEKQTQTNRRYQAAGMQQLVDAVRSTGAGNPIMLGGLDYADRLDGLLEHLPSDPANQLIAAWHPYRGNNCGLERPECWNRTVARVMQTRPVVAGEFGRNDCTADGLEAFMNWMDGHHASYLAWVWTITPEHRCPQQGGDGKYDLVVDYGSGSPTVPYGAAIRAHYRKS